MNKIFNLGEKILENFEKWFGKSYVYVLVIMNTFSMSIVIVFTKFMYARDLNYEHFFYLRAIMQLY